MTDQLTSTGLTIDSLQDRIANVKADLRASISAILDLSADQPSGQFVEIVTEKIQKLGELLEEIFTAFDPDQATGNSLAALALLTGTQKRAATYGTCAVTLDLDAAKTVPAGTLFAVAGDTDNQWALDEDVTSVGAGAYAGATTSTTAGAIQALAGTLTVIVTPVAGLNSVTNAADATEGRDEETDTELRLRREQEVTLGGSTSVDAIQAQLSDIDEIIQVVVTENDTARAQAGLPPHSFEAVIWDGAAPAASDAEIAETIFESKPAGIQPFGTTVEVHTDEQSNSHEIGFTRATVVYILVEIWVVTGPNYVGDTAVVQAINDAVEGLTIGQDVYRALIVDAVQGLQGVTAVEMVNGGNEPKLSRKPAAVAASDVSITSYEIAQVETMAADITVHS